MRERYDVIVVGAGSAGCALAARLSENATRKVLLLEAGPNYLGAAMPSDVRYAGLLKAMTPGNEHNWDFVAELRRGVLQPLPRGKVVGGSSAVNGALFTRGLPEDFDEWAAEGNSEWSYEKVLPYFKRMETDFDFHDSSHGDSGPMPVHRTPSEQWPSVALAFRDACREAGYPDDPDMNGPKSIGVGAIPTNERAGIRVNAAMAYLEPAFDRKNLVIKGATFVRRVVMDGLRAVGVEIGAANRAGEIIEADEIVLSAGAVKSPQLLLLSGIGQGDALRKLGIPLAVESPMVGREFTDHCSLGLRYRTKKHESLDPRRTTWAHAGLHYTSSWSDAPSDMLLIQSSIPLNRTMLFQSSLVQRARALQSAIGKMSVPKLYDQVRYGWHHSITCIIMRGVSRGTVTLTSNDPESKPTLRYNYLYEAEDRARLREAFRLSAGFLEHSSFRAMGAQRMSPDNSDMASDRELDDYLTSHVSTSIHMASSCRMGPERERAVVDQYCRVHGAEGLRVVDTSIMPTVVRRCPANTAIMLGERAAAFF